MMMLNLCCKIDHLQARLHAYIESIHVIYLSECMHD